LTRRQPGLGLSGHLFGQHLYEARFADAGFATEQHHLPEPLLNLRPALPQQRYFLLAAHQRGQAGAASGLQTTAGRAFIPHLIDLDGLSEAFQELGTERLAGKEAAEQR
jgi:hypothetical protein